MKAVLFLVLPFFCFPALAATHQADFRALCNNGPDKAKLKENLQGVTGVFIPGYLQEFYTSNILPVIGARIRKEPSSIALAAYEKAMTEVKKILADTSKPAAERLSAVRKATVGLAKNSLYGREFAEFFRANADAKNQAGQGDTIPSNFNYIFSPSHISIEDATRDYVCPQLKLIAEARGEDKLLVFGHSMGGAKGAEILSKCPDLFSKKLANGQNQLMGMVQVQPAMGGSHSPDSSLDPEVKAAWEEYAKSRENDKGVKALLARDNLRAVEAISKWQVEHYRAGLESLGSPAAAARLARTQALLRSNPDVAKRMLCVSTEATEIEANHAPVLKFYEYLRANKPELATRLYGPNTTSDGLVPGGSQCISGVANNHLHVTKLDHLATFFSGPVSEIGRNSSSCRRNFYGLMTEQSLRSLGAWRGDPAGPSTGAGADEGTGPAN